MPGASSQISLSGASSWAGRTSAVVISLSQALEIGDDRPQLAITQVDRRHENAWLRRRRVADPPGEIAGVVGEHAGAKRAPFPDVGEVRPDGSSGLRTSHRVA